MLKKTQNIAINFAFKDEADFFQNKITKISKKITERHEQKLYEETLIKSKANLSLNCAKGDNPAFNLTLNNKNENCENISKNL